MTEITIELDDARDVMHGKLVEMFSEQEVDETLEEQVVQHLTRMYDNRDELKSMEEQDNGDI